LLWQAAIRHGEVRRLKALYDGIEEAAKYPDYYYKIDEELCKRRAGSLNLDSGRQSVCPVMKPSHLRTYLVRLNTAVCEVVRLLRDEGYWDARQAGDDQHRVGTRVTASALVLHGHVVEDM
jgi:hypothetical protein